MKIPIPETRESGPLPYIIETSRVEVQHAIVEYAKALGKGVSVLSEAEKKQAWLNHVLEKYGS